MTYYGAKELADSFKTVRKNTILVAEDIPEDKYSFSAAEGVRTVAIVFEKAKELGIRMHILEGLHALLFEGKTLPEVLKGLMDVPQMEDVEFTGRSG